MVYDPREDSEMAVKWTNGDKDQTIGDDRGPWIMTFTGRHFHFMHPALNEVDIMDIAVSTSREGRFAGHCWSFYSVAQHCVHVSERVEMLLQQTGLKDPLHIAKVSMCALLHDASEGYIKDMPSPVKAHLPDYRRMEDTVQDVIMDCFGLLDLWRAPQTQSIIHTVDKAVMATEVRDLIKHKKVWHMPEKAYDDLKIVPVGPDTACVQFLYRFHSLKRILDENAS